MSEQVRARYLQPRKVVAFLAIGAFLMIGVAFSIQVLHYMKLIRSGELDPRTSLQDQQLRVSVSSHFANANVTQEDLKRVMPKAAAPTLGAEDAPLTIVEFLDYGCPYCKQTASVLRAYMAQHATNTRLILRDFPIVELHPDAENAAIAANCVFRIAPQRFWLYHDRLFATQPNHGATELRAYAAELGVNLSQYDTCTSQRVPLSDIRHSIEDGLAVGVQGTPTFFFNGVKISGALDAKQLELIAEEARANVKP